MHPGLRDYITDIIQDQYYLDPDSSNLHYIVGQLTETLQAQIDPPLPDRARILLHPPTERWGDYQSGIPWPPYAPPGLESPWVTTSYIRDEVEFKTYAGRLDMGGGREIELRIRMGYSTAFNQLVIQDDRKPDRAAMLKAQAEQTKRMEEARAQIAAEEAAKVPAWKKSIYITSGWREVDIKTTSIWGRIEQWGQAQRLAMGGGE